MTALEVELPNGAARKVILRRPGAAALAQNPRAAEEEFEILSCTHTLGLAVPEPLFFDPSGQIFSAPYLVIEYIEGKTEFAPADPNRAARQAAEQLARIHRADVSHLDRSLLPAYPKGLVETVLNPPARMNESMAENRIRDILRAAWPIPQPNAPALLHGDYWPGNLLWQGEQLSAVIDWEDAALGDPLADLAISRLDLLYIFGLEAMATFTGQYLARNPIDSTYLPAWDLCAALRLVRLGGTNLAEWASFFHPYGRTDITEVTILEQYRFFVEQAMEKLR
jgi:aminoglycoside phosphotransferase (APT) family kinase protein